MKINTYNIEQLSNYINCLRAWKGFERADDKINAERFPSCILYDSSKVSGEVVREVNEAAKKVIMKHLPLAEAKLANMFTERSDKE